MEAHRGRELQGEINIGLEETVGAGMQSDGDDAVVVVVVGGYMLEGEALCLC